MHDGTNQAIGRRRALGMIGMLGAGAIATACGGSSKNAASTASSSSSSATGSSSSSSSSSAGASAAPVSCVTLTPEVTEGPYYLDLNNVRRDITDGRPGTALDLKITVIDATTCNPIEGAAVDVWHCDATGVYSGFNQGQGATFLRGTQLTDRQGLSEFSTIVPGFYMGRAVHVHMKVHTGGTVVHTGQVFFDPTLISTVYASAPYSAHGSAPDTPNSRDSIYTQAGATNAVLKMTPATSGYTGEITVAVHSTAGNPLT